MEIQDNITKHKNSLIHYINPDIIKNLKKDLKSKSINKHKKFFKNYKANSEDDHKTTHNNFKKIETLEEFKEKLKQDGIKKKMNNLFKKNPEDSGSVLNINQNKNSDRESTIKRSICIGNQNKTINSSINDNISLNAKSNYFSVTSKNRKFDAISANNDNKSNINFNLTGNNFPKSNNNFKKFNTSMHSEIPIYIPKNIHFANILLGADPKKEMLNNVDFNVSFLLNGKKPKNYIFNNYNKNLPNLQNESSSNYKENLTKYETLVENTGMNLEENKNYSKGINMNYNKSSQSEHIMNNDKKSILINVFKDAENAKIEQEMNDLVRLYINNCDNDIKDDNLNNSSFLKLLNKYELNNFKNSEEEKFILEYLKKPKKLLESKESSNTALKKVSLDKVSIDKISYNNPITALRKLRLNKEIINNVNDYRQQKQIGQYLDIYNEQNDRKLKSMQMKNIKQTDFKANKIHEDIGEVINPQDLLSEKNDYDNSFNNNRQISRDQVLGYNLEFFSINNNDFKLKPWARSNFTLTKDGNQIIMFGGISGEILYQIWICDCKSNFFMLYQFFNFDY